jgi:glutathione peroxidase-family protein
MSSATSFYEFKPLDKRGAEFDLASLRDKYVLVVNTASKCGYTPQFKGLETLYQTVRARGGGDRFEILGFPCNQFAAQDPGSNDEIQSFCQLNYGVTFPVLSKVNVNGDDASPLWKWLKSERPGIMGIQMVKWNFEKFLVDPHGNVVDRWASTTKPETIGKTVFKLLDLPEAPAEGADDKPEL